MSPMFSTIALGLVAHLQVHLRGVGVTGDSNCTGRRFSRPLTVDRQTIFSSGTCSWISASHSPPAADVRAPVQAPVIQLPHLLDAFHELGELLELCPLVGATCAGTRLMLASIPLFATAAVWSGVAIPVVIPLILVLGISAVLLSGWGFQAATLMRQRSQPPPEFERHA
jgi:hypothetical protein